MNKKVYTQKAYAKKRNVTDRMVRYWIQQGKVKTVEVGGFEDVKGVRMIQE